MKWAVLHQNGDLGQWPPVLAQTRPMSSANLRVVVIVPAAAASRYEVTIEPNGD